MRTFIKLAGFVAAVTLAPGAVPAEEFRAERSVPVTRDGIVPVELAVGPVFLEELLVQDVPTDADESAALPKDALLDPRAQIVASQPGGNEEAKVRLVLTFQDEQGNAVLTCPRRFEQDEGSTNEATRVCMPVDTPKVSAADWAKVKTVRLEVTVTTRD
jgi:hypothetical protein